MCLYHIWQISQGQKRLLLERKWLFSVVKNLSKNLATYMKHTCSSLVDSENNDSLLLQAWPSLQVPSRIVYWKINKI